MPKKEISKKEKAINPEQFSAIEEMPIFASDKVELILL